MRISRLPDAMRLDKRAGRLKVDRCRLQKPQQSPLHDGEPVPDPGLVAETHQPLNQTETHERQLGRAQTAAILSDRESGDLRRGCKRNGRQYGRVAETLHRETVL